MSAIHGTESSIARLQTILKRNPGTIYSTNPMDAAFGVPFVIHETEEQAAKAAWRQAVDTPCKVVLVDQYKYMVIDGFAMREMLEPPRMPFVFSRPGPIFKVRP